MMGRWCSWGRPWPRASACALSATRAGEVVVERSSSCASPISVTRAGEAVTPPLRSARCGGAMPLPDVRGGYLVQVRATHRRGNVGLVTGDEEGLAQGCHGGVELLVSGGGCF